MRLSISALTAIMCLALVVAGHAEADAGFCEVRFQFNVGPVELLQRRETSLRLKTGETRIIGQSRMDFIINVGPNSLMAWLTGGPRGEILLSAGERMPEARVGYFFGPRPVRLDRLNCLPAQVSAYGLSREHGIADVSANPHAGP